MMWQFDHDSTDYGVPPVICLPENGLYYPQNGHQDLARMLIMITPLPITSPVPSGSHQRSRTYAPPSLLAGVRSQGYLLPSSLVTFHCQ